MDTLMYNALPPAKRRLWQEFLSRMELSAGEDAEQTVLVLEDGQLIATGSRTKNLLKCLAVNPAWQRQGTDCHHFDAAAASRFSDRIPTADFVMEGNKLH